MEGNDELIRDLDRALEAVLADMCRRTPGARSLRQGGLFLAIGSDPSPVIVNSILPVDPDVGLDALEQAVDVYREIGHAVSIFTRDHLDATLRDGMAARGFHRFLALPEMVLRDRPAAEPWPDGVEIHRVETEADLEHWLEANLHAFAEDDSDRDAMRSAFSTLGSLVGGPIAGFYAEADGTMAGASMVSVDLATRIGLVGWVGTNPAFRRRGIGRAVSLAAARAGFDLGASLVSLQASPMGLPVYAKLGFETVTGYGVWLPPG